MSEDPRRPATVQVPRGVAAGAVAALVVAALALAFLLGRQSAQDRHAPAAPPSALRPSQPPPEPPAAPPAGAPAAARADSAVAPEPPALPAQDAPSAAPPVLAASPQPSSREKEDVARYFQEIDAAESRAKYWDDPEALAKALLDQAGRGDASGFDKLIGVNQRARDDVRALGVPVACQEHHRLTLALMDDAISLLKQVREKAAAQDEGALLAVPAAAHELEAKARQADQLAADLKRRFGVER